jgi:hypothetical protein
MGVRKAEFRVVSGGRPAVTSEYSDISSATMTHDDNESLVAERVADKFKVSISTRSVAGR